MAAPPPEGPSLANPGEEMERSLQGWASSGDSLTYLGSECPIIWAAVGEEAGRWTRVADSGVCTSQVIMERILGHVLAMSPLSPAQLTAQPLREMSRSSLS